MLNSLESIGHSQEMTPEDVRILLHTDHYVVVDKPPRMLVHRSEIANGDTTFLLQLVRDKLGRKVWPLSRLDRGTSGAIIFCYNPADLKLLTEAASIEKFYSAVVRGFTPDNGNIDKPLKPPVDPYLRTQKTQEQAAHTSFKTIARAELPVPYGQFEKTRISLLTLWLSTGRQHQIRRHLKWLSHPIIGDATYGKGPLNRSMYEYFGIERMLLHCSLINICDPWGGKYSVFAEPQGEFKSVLEKCQWTQAYKSEFDTLKFVM